MINGNADKIPCELLHAPKDAKYAENIRKFQGCPTIAITPKGRIFLGWYSGGIKEPHMENYNLIVYSDDHGKTWSDPVLVIPSSKEHRIHALDIQLWTAPDGKLHVYWVQNNTLLETDPKPEIKPNQPWVCVDGYQFPDFVHSEWLTVCDDPDADELKFSPARYVDIGFLRCKPLVTASGRQINFNYDQEHDRYGYSISDDNGKTFTHMYGAKKLATSFDESMAYQRLDGSIRMLARSHLGCLAESISYDDGMTWSEAKDSGISSPSTRFYISRTPSGRILLIHNDHQSSR
nr:exo-alpha-sialidase [Clostridia bacterium]